MNKIPSKKNTPTAHAAILPNSPLPTPAPDKHGTGKITALAILAIILLIFTGYWLTRSTPEKINLRHDLANMVNDTLKNTPLAGAGNIIAPAPEKPKTPPTDAGTLAGREVAGTIAAPIELGPLQGAAGYALPRAENPQDIPNEPSVLQTMAEVIGLSPASEEEPVIFSQDVLPPASEDNILKADFINRLAAWLVKRYNQGGYLAASPQALNQECGITLTENISGGRRGLLRYAFHPTMLTALYKLYIDRFMDNLNTAAQKRGLNEQQIRQFHQSLAGKSALLASAVSAVEQVPNLQKQIQSINELGKQAINANTRFTSMISELDRVRGSTAPESTLKLIQNQVQSAAQAYTNADYKYAEAQANLATAIRQHAGPGLGDEALLFIAFWIDRRLISDKDAQATISTAKTLLQDLAARCAKIAEEQ